MKFAKYTLGLGLVLGIVLVPSHGAAGLLAALFAAPVAVAVTWAGLTSILGETRGERAQAWGCGVLMVVASFAAVVAIAAWGS